MPPSSFDQLQKRLSDEYPLLSRRLKEVCDYVTQHPQSVALDTAAVVADKAGVHASTLVRFANYFEFSGFSGMQKLYKQHLLDALQGNYNDRIATLSKSTGQEGDITAMTLLAEFGSANQESLGTLKEQTDPTTLTQAVDLIERAAAIHIGGVRRAFPVTMYFAYTLAHLRRNCHAISGLGLMHEDQLANIRAGELLIAITFAPYADSTQAMIETAHNNGADILLISDDANCPGAARSTIVLPVADAEVRGFRSLTSSMCLAQALCIALGYRQPEARPLDDNRTQH